MKTKHLLMAMGMLAMSLAAQASTYYCSPTGSGNGNSYATPCSFADGIKKLKAAGDTLYMLGGQYNLGNTQLKSLNGSSSRRIVIAGYPGETAIMDFRTTPYGTRGLQLDGSCSYVHIKNLTLRYSGKNNLYNGGSFCLFEQLDIYGSADTGCQMKGGGNNVILNVDSHDNFDYQHYGSDGKADFGGNADGFADKQFTGAGNHYIGCRSWNNSDDGWDFYQRISNTETIIENCICYKNGPAEYDMRGHARYQTDKAFFDRINGTTITNRYDQEQVVSLEHYPNHGNGNGFKLGGGYTNHVVLVHHCLSVANTVRGFDQNNNDGVMRIWNNTGYLNGYNFGFTTAYGTLTIQNNISYQGVNADAPHSQVTLANDHNSWNNNSASASDFISLDTTQILLPRQADGSLAETTLMHLQANSKFVNAGEVVGLPYYGAAPDMGCYEVEVGEQVIPEEPKPEVYECKEGAYKIAFVSLADAASDRKMLQYLRANDSLCVMLVEAAIADEDYSEYDCIVLGPKPNSAAAGYTQLKGYDKPMLVLKPFIFKNSVWNWGSAVNTQELSIQVADTTHALFHGLSFGQGNQLKLFSECTTNAVTAISEWTNSQVTSLASPVGNSNYCSLSVMPTGTNMNGTVLTKNMVMLGISEYSTAQLTQEGLQLVENCIYYLLGKTAPTRQEDTAVEQINISSASKRIQNGQVVIVRDGKWFDMLGREVRR